jgi:hypothetical protein
MLVKESEWFKYKIESYLSNSDCVLNVGSSTKRFRENIQPHIQRNIFDILQQKKIQVYHVDMKNDIGVDLVGDVADEKFIKALQNLRPTAIICSNLLEHLENRSSFCAALLEIIPESGIILASCPKDYVYHPDPIDTMFRPSVEELAAEFPHTEIVEGLVLPCGTYGDIELYERRINFRAWMVNKLKRLGKDAVEQYRSVNEGRKTVERAIDRDDKVSATCVVLRKTGTSS